MSVFNLCSAVLLKLCYIRLNCFQIHTNMWPDTKLSFIMTWTDLGQFQMFSEAVSSKLGHVKCFFSTQPIYDTKSERNPQCCLTPEVTALSVLSLPLTKTSEGHIPPPDPILSCHEQTQDIPLSQTFHHKDSHCRPSEEQTGALCFCVTLSLNELLREDAVKWMKERTWIGFQKFTTGVKSILKETFTQKINICWQFIHP